MVVDTLFHEAVDLLRYLLLCVKKGLFLVVLPVQRQVKNSDSFPEIAELCAGRVHDAHNFIRHYKFEILQKHRRVRVKLDFMKKGVRVS